MKPVLEFFQDFFSQLHARGVRKIQLDTLLEFDRAYRVLGMVDPKLARLIKPDPITGVFVDLWEAIVQSHPERLVVTGMEVELRPAPPPRYPHIFEIVEEFLNPSQTEMEVQLKVDREGHQRLLQTFPVESTTRQTNHYLDTENWVLAGQKTTLRLREIEGGYRLTLKKHMSSDHTLRICSEQEIEIDPTVAEQILGGTVPPPLLDHFELTGAFTVKGKTLTTRKVLRVGSGRVELDETIFPSGRVDYEVEIESDHTNLAAEIQRIVPTTPSRESKFERFRRDVLAARP